MGGRACSELREKSKCGQYEKEAHIEAHSEEECVCVRVRVSVYM